MIVSLKSQCQDLDKKDFYLSSEGMKLNEVVREISNYYKVNIILYDDIKDKEISVDFEGLNFAEALDSVCWLSGVEWVKNKDSYYVGGNREEVVVIDSFGLPTDITTTFKNVSVIGDKAIVTGSEREVKRIVLALKELSKKTYVNVWLIVYEIGYDNTIDFGVDWEYFIKYSFSWNHLIQGQFNPIQTLAVSFLASVKADEKYWNIDTLINTNVGILSGTTSTINAVSEIDREIFNDSQFGERVVSSFSTQTTGLIVELKGYNTDGDTWLFDINIENSRSESDLEKKSINFVNKAIVKRGEGALLGIIKEKTESYGYMKGFPYISRIPYFGALFALKKIVNIDKKVVVMLFLEPKEKDKSEVFYSVK